MTINSETGTLDVNVEALELISRNIASTGVHKIAIVSVMGAYRTGKSFLLDLFLRFLRAQEAPPDINEENTEASGIPPWLMREGGVISEGRTKDIGKVGFEWRGGMDKVTEGLWIWSKPYVLELNRSGGESSYNEKLCVLLLDSQGAFDSKLTKEQSATIFGLTAILSSYQIYNVSKQIQEDTIENLHYFMECAGSCVRLLQSESMEDPGTTLFQHLQFLVRDWPNFESDWNMDRCERQMNEHLAQHLEDARDNTTSEALKNMFASVSCWMLPHPGLVVNKSTWTGDIHDLDKEFLKFLDAYVHRVFSGTLNAKEILGKPLSASTFVDVVTTLAKSFTGLVPEGVNLATALARTTNLMNKEQSLQQYRNSLEDILNVKYKKGLPAVEFHKLQTEARDTALELFVKGTRFGPVSERDAVQEELMSEIGRLDRHYADENRRRMESALTGFAGIALLICILYSLDKLSDVTCDWYSQTCVRMSNALLLVYSLLAIGVLTNVYLLFQSKGRAVAVVAVIEMGKSVVTLAMELGDYVKKIIHDLRESKMDNVITDAKSLWTQFAQEILRGLHELGSAITNR